MIDIFSCNSIRPIAAPIYLELYNVHEKCYLSVVIVTNIWFIGKYILDKYSMFKIVEVSFCMERGERKTFQQTSNDILRPIIHIFKKTTFKFQVSDPNNSVKNRIEFLKWPNALTVLGV